MTREEEWQREWEVLRAERARARREWRGAADGLSAWSRDPLGLGKLVRGHPLAATGISAAVGALLGKFLQWKVGAAKEESPEAAEPARPAVAWTTVLRDAAVGLAVPWLLRTLKEKFGGVDGPEGNEGERRAP